MVDRETSDALKKLWDDWWYNRFEIPLEISPNARRFEIDVEGEVSTAVLLEEAAPKTCQAFWEILPAKYHLIHCAFFGHAAFPLERIELPGVTELENRTQRFCLGDMIYDPLLPEITIAYGRYAEVRFPTTPWFGSTPHPHQACLFAKIVENLQGFADMCKRTRIEGAKIIEFRRKI